MINTNVNDSKLKHAQQKKEFSDAFLKIKISYDAALEAFLTRQEQHQRIHLQNMSMALRQVVELSAEIVKTFPSVKIKTQFLLKSNNIPHVASKKNFLLCVFENGVSIPVNLMNEISKMPEGEDDYTLGLIVKSDKERVHFKSYFYGAGKDRTDLAKINTKMVNLYAWINQPPARVQYMQDGKLKTQSLSRANIIKRIANIKGGAHPQTTADQYKNEYDEAIREMERHSVGGFSIDYFLLLGFAESLISFGVSVKLIT